MYLIGILPTLYLFLQIVVIWAAYHTNSAKYSKENRVSIKLIFLSQSGVGGGHLLHPLPEHVPPQDHEGLPVP